MTEKLPRRTAADTIKALERAGALFVRGSKDIFLSFERIPALVPIAGSILQIEPKRYFPCTPLK